MDANFSIEAQKAWIEREIEFMKGDIEKYKDDLPIVGGILFSLQQLERAEAHIEFLESTRYIK